MENSQPAMRAKVRVTKAEAFSDGQRVTFNAVGRSDSYPADGSDEDNTFAKFTPSATFDMQINNPALSGKFKEGDTFYVDFTPVAQTEGGKEAASQ